MDFNFVVFALIRKINNEIDSVILNPKNFCDFVYGFCKTNIDHYYKSNVNVNLCLCRDCAKIMINTLKENTW